MITTRYHAYMYVGAIKHTVNGQEYEIRCIETDQGWEVTTSRAGMRVSPRYMVSFETGQEFRHHYGDRAIEVLSNLAINDLNTGFVK